MDSVAWENTDAGMAMKSRLRMWWQVQIQSRSVEHSPTDATNTAMRNLPTSPAWLSADTDSCQKSG